MPIKFKIYYASSIYMLLWSTGIFIYGAYSMLTEDFARGDTGIGLLILLAFGLTGVKTIFNLRALRNYKQSSMPSGTERVLFIIGFCFIILMAIGLLLLSFFVIIPSDFRRQAYNDSYSISNYRLLFVDSSFFIAGACAIHMAIYDLILLKEIGRKQIDNLLSFEIESDEQP
jgi:hypothetical protein